MLQTNNNNNNTIIEGKIIKAISKVANADLDLIANFYTILRDVRYYY